MTIFLGHKCFMRILPGTGILLPGSTIILAVMLAFLFGCGSGGDDPESHPVTKAAFSTIHTVRHDGHMFVVARATEAVSIVHHPGCECMKVKVEEERK